MRFFLDHDVQAGVGRALRDKGHECWSAQEAGLNEAADDALTVYAAGRRAVLITHDKEFSRRRRSNVTGWHVQLLCQEWEAAELLISHLDEIITMVTRHQDVFLAVSAHRVDPHFGWH